MSAKKRVSIVLVLAMLLTMTFAVTLFAEEDEPLTLTQPLPVTEDSVDGAPQMALPFAAARVDVVTVIKGDSGVDPDKAGTIQDGVDKVNPGGTVVVKAGTYNEIVNVDNSMTIKTTEGAVVNGGFVIYNGEKNVTISGFTINSVLKAAISINSGAEKCTIKDNTINADEGYGIIMVGQQDGHVIENNVFNGDDAWALICVSRQPDISYTLDPIRNSGSFYYSKDISILDNEFNGDTSYCIVMNAEKSVIKGNVFNADINEPNQAGCVTYEPGARIWVKVNSELAGDISGNTFNEFTRYNPDALQFKDTTNTWTLEAVRTANTFLQAVYFVGGFDTDDQILNPMRGNFIYYYIQDAVDCAYSVYDVLQGKVAEDTICVGAGTYTEDVYIGTDKLTPNLLEMLLDTSITLINVDEPFSAIINNDSDMDNPSLEILNTKVHLEGFEVYGMLARNADGSFFDGNRFTGKNIGATIKGEDTESVLVATVSNNVFTGNAKGGLLVSEFKKLDDKNRNLMITGNQFINNGIPHGPCCDDRAVIGYGARVVDSVNVHINDNNFAGNTGNGLELVRVFGCSTPTLIEDNYFDNNGDGWAEDQGAADEDGNGIYAVDCDDIHVIDNKSIATNSHNGIYFDGCTNILVDRNNDLVEGYAGIVNNGVDGVLFVNDFGRFDVVAEVDPSFEVPDNMIDVVITNNTISNNGDDGVEGIVADTVTIASNIICDNGENGVDDLIAEDELDVNDNKINGNGDTGLDVEFAEEASILNNEIVGNGADDEDDEEYGAGIELEEGGFAEVEGYAVTIAGNTINLNNGGGIILGSETTDVLIEKNNIRENGYGGYGEGGIYIGGGAWSAQVHYNNIVDNSPYGLEVAENEENDALNAETLGKSKDFFPRWFTFNFWGDISGPEDVYQRPFADHQAGEAMSGDENLLGTGNAILFPDCDWFREISVGTYAPWLSKEFETLDNSSNIAQPVIPFAVNKGWNLISTPELLDVNSWSEIAAMGNGLDASLILGYDAASGEWQYDSTGMTFKPQNAYYLRMNSVDFVPLVIKTYAVDESWSVPVVKSLNEGWNLVAKADDNKDPMTVREVLSSAQGEISGWSYVIHPGFDYGYGRNQGEYTYTRNTLFPQWMVNFAGYWVYMNSDENLAGGTTTYVWDWDHADATWNKLLSLTDRILDTTDPINP